MPKKKISELKIERKILEYRAEALQEFIEKFRDDNGESMTTADEEYISGFCAKLSKMNRRLERLENLINRRELEGE